VKEMVPSLWDDLERLEDPAARVAADHTRFLGWEGRWYELDMTTIHTLEIEAFLEPYLKAGTLTDNPPRVKRPGLGGAILKANEENKKKAAWADAHGYPYTTRKAGGFYFPVRTERAYQEAQRGLGSSGPERREADAGDRVRQGREPSL
jgi:hypothetical protein